MPSVTAVRTFSISAGLDASTVTPGSSAPDVSFTSPAIDACAHTAAGAARITIAAAMTAHTRPTLPFHENRFHALPLYLGLRVPKCCAKSAGERT